MRKAILGLAVILLGSMVSAPAALAQAPGLFFNDLSVASNSGGESVSGFAGAYVTIFGNNFGASQGTSTVSWNGLQCLRVVSWSQSWLWYQKMVVQVGASCTPGTGNLVVTNSTGASNGLPLTVKAIGSNHIYFVASNGNDNNPGTASQPFLTMKQCVHGPSGKGSGGNQGPVGVATPGDVCYVSAGVNQTSLDTYGSLDLCIPGTASLPLALLAYPGTALSDTIGSDTRDKGLFINGGAGECNSGQYWTVQGFILRANTMAAQIYSPNNRLVGNFIECPAVVPGTTEGCVEPASTTNISVIGNEITNIGPGGKEYHAIYFGADGHSYEAGWNKIHDIQACRAIQVFNGAVNSYNISIHDNLIYNIPCDGINLAAVNPGSGYVNVFNNVVYNAGSGPDEGGQNATCLNLAAQGSASGTAQVYNNTFYNCGALGSSDSALLSPYISTAMYNNIIVSNGKEPYFTSGAGSSHLSGSNNLWFGKGNGPTQTSANINSDPLFVSAASANFLLLATSPVIGAGIGSQTTPLDIGGLARPTPPSIGAHEFSAGTLVKPNPPTSLKVTVQ